MVYRKMYVTSSLSLLKKSPELLTKVPDEGPNSGYLVFSGEEHETTDRYGRSLIDSLPFPQNKNFFLTYYDGDSFRYTNLAFFPVLDQPLSSNAYYVINLLGKHLGEAFTSSKEEDKKTIACCCAFIKDAKPKPLDPFDIYQQFKIRPMKHNKFSVVSLASDGYPPIQLRNKDFIVETDRPRFSFHVHEEALGLDASVRAARLPDLSCSNTSRHTRSGREGGVVVVGKWCCPYMFVKEDNMSLEQQLRLSVFYEMTLEQRWEKIFGCRRKNDNSRDVHVDVLVEREEVFVFGRKSTCCEESELENGVVWFKSSCDGDDIEEIKRLGLSIKIVERMKWVQERGGWVDGSERRARVERREEFQGSSTGWTKFSCYVLVERFVLKRANKSVVFAHDFKHTHQVRCEWE